MYAREVEGQVLTFGVSGKLIRNALVMYDRETDSLWSQLLGEAVDGPMVGAGLTFLPSWQTTWQEWRAMQPDTLALNKTLAAISDPYEDYYLSDAAGVIGETFADGRLPVKEYVVGVELEGAAVAYPYRLLSQTPVVNDTVAGQPLLVLFEPETAASAVFSRRVDGQVLTFAQAAGGERRLSDAETGSLWDTFSGEAVAGPLLGTRLARLKSTSVFWFGWKDYFPDTFIYGD